MDPLRTLLAIAKLAAEGAEHLLPPEPSTHVETAPPEPAPRVKHQGRAKTAPVPDGPKRKGFPLGSKFFKCDDCGKGFASTASLLDVVCKHCGSIHAKPRERKQNAPSD